MRANVWRIKLWRLGKSVRRGLRPCSGQAVLEYAVLVAIVAAAFISMSFYIKRAVQGSISMIESKGVVAKADSAPTYEGPHNW
ncbi:MAG: hypothetical protein ABIC68_00360 [Candidatus Omnitrophota bacterium]